MSLLLINEDLVKELQLNFFFLPLDDFWLCFFFLLVRMEEKKKWKKFFIPGCGLMGFFFLCVCLIACYKLWGGG